MHLPPARPRRVDGLGHVAGALGVSLTAVLSTLVFGEPFTPAIGLGIALIVAGVLLIELGSHSAGGEAGGGREGVSA